MIERKIQDELGAIVGEDGFFTDKEDLASYSYDAFVREFMPEAVILPRSAEEVSRIMKVADREGLKIVARGAGTNLSGNSVARQGGMIMSFTRMNRIVEIDIPNRCAVVQPGVINLDLQKEVMKRGFFYPPDPASMAVCTLGGNVALNAGGPRAVKYGVTRDYVMGLEVVLADGEIIKTGGKTLKNVTGYDLTRLLVGSEGTLGLVTQITLRLIPLPQARKTLLAAFSSVEEVAQTVSAILSAGIIPTTLELMDRVIVDVIRDAGGAIFPSTAGAVLLIEVDGDKDLVEKESRKVADFCRDRGALAVETAKTQEEADRLWQARRSVGGALYRVSPSLVVEDAVVPVSELPRMINRIEALSRKHNLKVGVLAHAGDGNLHPDIMTDVRNLEEMERVERFIEEMYLDVIALGGTLSGEHGIGLGKEKYMALECSKRTLDLMRGIKRVFDPKNLLNPGSFL
jgi:glycolate oxidase